MQDEVQHYGSRSLSALFISSENPPLSDSPLGDMAEDRSHSRDPTPYAQEDPGTWSPEVPEPCIHCPARGGRTHLSPGVGGWCANLNPG